MPPQAHQNLHHIDGRDPISQARGIPPKYLEQILLVLKRAAYLRSVQGKNGGYILAKAPDRITLAEIIRLFNVPLAPTSSTSVFFYAPSPIEKDHRLLSVFQSIQSKIAASLESLTLADL